MSKGDLYLLIMSLVLIVASLVAIYLGIITQSWILMIVDCIPLAMGIYLFIDVLKLI